MTRNEYKEEMDYFQSKFANQIFIIEIQMTGNDSENIYDSVRARTGYELFKEVEELKINYGCDYVYVIGRFYEENYKPSYLSEIRDSVKTIRNEASEKIKELGGVCV